jgi:hypothetical protein
MEPTTTGWTIGINFSRGVPALITEKRSSGRKKMGHGESPNDIINIKMVLTR